MNLVNDQLTREKLQMVLFKTLIGVIVLSAIIFLIKNEGLFFGIH